MRNKEFVNLTLVARIGFLNPFKSVFIYKFVRGSRNGHHHHSELHIWIHFEKVMGQDNPADMWTKNVEHRVRNKHLKIMRFEYREGRAHKAVGLNPVALEMAGQNIG